MWLAAVALVALAAQECSGLQFSRHIASRSLAFAPHFALSPAVHAQTGGLKRMKMGEWKQASANTVIHAPIADIWRVWSDFSLMPRWQPWISEVIVNQDSTSKWTLRKSVLGVPLSFSWTARELPPLEHKLIHWEASAGLENKGQVDFTELPEGGVDVRMTISYKLPTVLAIMFRGRTSKDTGGPVNAAVKKILLTDLKRFKHAMETTPEIFL